MSLSFSWMAYWTFSASSSVRRVSSCFRISSNTCTQATTWTTRQEGQTPLGGAKGRAPCLLGERWVVDLPQRSGHALQGLRVAAERGGSQTVLVTWIRRRGLTAEEAVGVGDVGERRHCSGRAGDSRRRSARRAQAEAAQHDEGGVGTQGNWRCVEPSTAGKRDARRREEEED